MLQKFAHYNKTVITKLCASFHFGYNTSLNSTKQVINTLLIILIAIVSKTESTASHRIPRHRLLFRTAKMKHAALNMTKLHFLHFIDISKIWNNNQTTPMLQYSSY